MEKVKWIVFCDDDYGCFDECTGKAFDSKDDAKAYCEKMNEQHAPAFFYSEKVCIR